MENSFVFPVSLRVLPPAGGYPSEEDISNTWNEVKQTSSIQNIWLPKAISELSRAFNCSSLTLCSSGTASLSLLLSALRLSTGKNLIGISAYTCPDVASAAIKAGFRLAILDIFEHSLEIDHVKVDAKLLPSLAAVVLSNLYGLPDRIEAWRQLSADHGFLLIDDACQSINSLRGAFRVGTLPGSVGVVSFGRGKAVHGIGGGAIVWPHGDDSAIQELKSSVENSSSNLQLCQAEGFPLEIGKYYGDVLRRLEQPDLFRIPASLPFLGLGRTECKLKVKVGGISLAQLVFALAQVRKQKREGNQSNKKSKAWAEGLVSLAVEQPLLARSYSYSTGVDLIRFPLLFKDGKARDIAYRAMSREGLGVSVSYPKSLDNFEPLRQSIASKSSDCASRVATKVMTLPVHRYVTDSDINQGLEIIKNSI